jgi:hypothetical protein
VTLASGKWKNVPPLVQAPEQHLGSKSETRQQPAACLPRVVVKVSKDSERALFFLEGSGIGHKEHGAPLFRCHVHMHILPHHHIREGFAAHLESDAFGDIERYIETCVLLEERCFTRRGIVARNQKDALEDRSPIGHASGAHSFPLHPLLLLRGMPQLRLTLQLGGIRL